MKRKQQEKKQRSITCQTLDCYFPRKNVHFDKIQLHVAA